MKTDTPKTDAELKASKGRLSFHLVALCKRMERERNAFEREYERIALENARLKYGPQAVVR